MKIIFDRKEIEVKEGTTLLQVARENGISVPTFCHDDRLKPFSSCYICVMEVEGPRGKILTPSCSTEVSPNMIVESDNERIRASRKTALDLMLSDHSGDCIGPCVTHCPAHTDVQGYVAHLADGNHYEALKLIKEKLAMPIACGRICPHPCEAECRRGIIDRPIEIRNLKRWAAECDLKDNTYLPPVESDSGFKVAVVGGGPAGLATSYYLRQMGHEVHLFEALPDLGGMTRYGIPKFRLPWDELDAEIKSIIDIGVHVHTKKKLGIDFSLESLKQDRHAAICLAIGAHKSKTMGIENENVAGVIGGIDFLRKVVLGEIKEVGPNVVVVGGGDVAMDCARVAKRLSNKDVSIFYRRGQEEMTALKYEQEEALEDGVSFRYLIAPIKAHAKANGEIEYLEIMKMRLMEPDSTGRRRPVPVSGSEELVKVDLVISAIGQDPDHSWAQKDLESPTISRYNTIIYDENMMTTSMDGVFTAGDCAFGPDTVVRALGEGRKAAMAIDLYLKKAPIEFKKEYAISKGRVADFNKEEFAPRFKYYHQRKNVGVFKDGEVFKSVSQAKDEAQRCLECGCNTRFDCSLRDYATEYGADESVFKGEKRSREVDERHPLIRIESDKCITCGACVRFCDEVRRISALSFVGRGFTTKIAPTFDDSLNETSCDGCGMCVDLCPTGALSINVTKFSGPWKSKERITTCMSCGRGCALKVVEGGGHAIEIKSVHDDATNNGIICREGRLSHQLLNMRSPLDVKQRDKMIVSIRKIISNTTKSTGIVISPFMTIEDHYVAFLLAKKIGATLFYQTSSGDDKDSQYPNAKLPMHANLSFLKKLGATPLDEKKCRSLKLLIVVGAYIEFRKPKFLKVIAISPFQVGVNANLVVLTSDLIERNGKFLNINGKISQLVGKNGVDNEHAPYIILAKIIDEEKYTDTVFIQKELINNFPKLSETLLKSVIEYVGLDARGYAFKSFIKRYRS